LKFPNPEHTNDDGLLCVGGPLNTETLLSAYSQGIFPWPQEGYPILWFSPPERGVLFFDQMKIPDSTLRVLKKNIFTVTYNQNFKQVISECAEVHRQRQEGTWISKDMIKAYVELFENKQALSVEVWFKNELVGGLYGVYIKSIFSGESMFYKKSEASKVAIFHMVEFLKQKGVDWMDTQMVTPVLAQFGAQSIDRKIYLELLKKSQT